MLANGRWDLIRRLTLNLLTTTIVAPPSNASKWQMGFNSAFKGLRGETMENFGCALLRARRDAENGKYGAGKIMQKSGFGRERCCIEVTSCAERRHHCA